MSKEKVNYCKCCGKEYLVCPKCESTGIFRYRLSFCSKQCFIDFMNGDIKMITVQYESKTYGVKEPDFKNGIYVTTNGLELKEDELQAVILPIAEYKKIKYGRYTKPKVETKEEEK